jgi:hypothetical protein
MPKLSGSESVKYIHNLSGDVISIGNRLDILNDKELIGINGINLTNHPKVISLTDPTISLDFNIVAKGNHLHPLTDITSGTFDPNRLPQITIEKYHEVSDDTARHALLQVNVRNGDLVKQSNAPSGPEELYLVIDNTKLSNLDNSGFLELNTSPETQFNNSNLISCSWNGITGLPDYIKYDSYFRDQVLLDIPDHTGGDVISGVNYELNILNKRQLVIGDGIIGNSCFVIASADPVISINFNNICSGNNSKLSDSRIPLPHTHRSDDIDFNSAFPQFSTIYRDKLDGIDINANKFIHPNHSGDVTGSTVLTIVNNSVTGNKIKDEVISGDKLEIPTNNLGLDLTYFRKDLTNKNKLVGTDSNGDYAFLTPGNNKLIKTNNDGKVIFDSIGSTVSKDHFLLSPLIPIRIKDVHSAGDQAFSIDFGNFKSTNTSVFDKVDNVINVKTPGLYYFEVSGKITFGPGSLGKIFLVVNERKEGVLNTQNYDASFLIPIDATTGIFKFNTYYNFISPGKIGIYGKLTTGTSNIVTLSNFSSVVTLGGDGNWPDKKSNLTELYFLGKKI